MHTDSTIQPRPTAGPPSPARHYCECARPLAVERAAALYGLQVIAGDVGDHPESYTRFVSVATHTRIDRADATWRTAFSFVTDHRPGALHRAIEPFARHGIDLVQVQARRLKLFGSYPSAGSVT